jgi:hypothetical protein
LFRNQFSNYRSEAFRALEAKYPAIPVVDVTYQMTKILNDESYWVDDQHLKGRGAVVYTDLIHDNLCDIMSGF